MHVIYKGPAHVRTLGAADLRKVGVEGFRSTDFRRGESVEVPDVVGLSLIESPIFGNFAEGAAPEIEGAPQLLDAVAASLPQSTVPAQPAEPDVDQVDAGIDPEANAAIDAALAEVDAPDPAVLNAKEEPTITEAPKPARKSSKA